MVRFFAEELEPGGADDAFLKPGEAEIKPVKRLPGLVCRECNRLNPRTPAGYLPTRTRCERCQRRKENGAWRGRDPEKARELWREAKNAYRRRHRGTAS